jgi:hypothetical protein
LHRRSDSVDRKRRGAALLAGVVIATASVALCLLLVEAVLRLVPAALPAGVYGSGVRHPELGTNVYAGPVIYNRVRRSTRVPNHDGFLDTEHERAKPAGVLRIGFFGDSYVEAYQVPLDAVFYRRLGAALAPRIETLGFGMSGWGTYQGFRAYRILAPAYALDAAVYVFVENDLGDQLYELAARTRSPSSAYPFAQLEDAAPDGFSERWTLEPGRESPGWRFAKALQRHSLLAHIVRERLALLASQGMHLRAEPEAEQMAQATRGVPLSTDLPGTWPAAWAEPAQELGRRVLAAWARDAAQRGVRFAVLYVPRSEAQLRGEIPLDQTWKPWLEATSAELGIPLVDPSEALREQLVAGRSVYDDHWTPAGHEVIATVLHEFLATWLGDQG